MVVRLYLSPLVLKLNRMAKIIIFGYGSYKKAEYNNISNKKVDELARLYRDDASVYHIEKTYDKETDNGNKR